MRKQITIICLLAILLAGCNAPAGTAPDPAASVTVPVTAQPSAAFVPVGSRILSFAVSPPELLDPAWRQLQRGSPITLSWQVEGLAVQICMGGDVESCRKELPASGSITWILPDSTEDWLRFEIAALGQTDYAIQELLIFLPCRNTWFEAGLSEKCPGPAISETYTAQLFEKGAMFLHGKLPYEIPRWISVQSYSTGQYYEFSRVPPAAPDLSAFAPPPGLFLPGDPFAALWPGSYKGSEELRDRLGWATGPMFEYTWRSQCESYDGGPVQRCFQVGPDGRIFSFDVLSWINPPDHPDGLSVMLGKINWWEGHP